MEILAHPHDSSAEMATDASEFFASVETIRSNVETFDMGDDSSRPGSRASSSKLGKYVIVVVIL
jgi:hypothetical protein